MGSLKEDLYTEKKSEHELVKVTRVQYNNRQYTITIPDSVVNALKIKKGSKVKFAVNLEKDPQKNKGHFTIGDK